MAKVSRKKRIKSAQAKHTEEKARAESTVHVRRAFIRDGRVFVEIEDIDDTPENTQVLYAEINGDLKAFTPAVTQQGGAHVAVRENIRSWPASKLTSVEKRRSFLKGFGSILDLNPHIDYREFVSKETPSQRMRGHFDRTGRRIFRAIKKVDAECG